jgi:integrase
MVGSKLNAAKIAKLGDGRHGDGQNLWLQVRGQNRSWLLRYRSPETGKPRQMGLGEYPLIGLKEVREARDKLRLLLRNGIDPLAQAQRERAEAQERERRQRAEAVTFRQAAEQYIAAHKPAWKGRRSNEGQWAQSLEDHVYPVIGDTPCSAITTELVLNVLSPIWTKIPPTAQKVRGRTEAILDYAQANGWRTGGNPAAWKGNLAFTLPATRKVKPIKHHPAMEIRAVPAFMQKLESIPGAAPLALRFVVLTASRTVETLHARWNEIDLETRVWTVPADRMKAQKEHRVPLSDAAMEVLAEATKRAGGNDQHAYVFPPDAMPKRPLSDTALIMFLRRQALCGLTVHGFRSTFRDWAGESTNHPREVVEMALAHRLGDQAERAYARGDLFQKRRRLMDEWAEFCGRPAGATWSQSGVLDDVRRNHGVRGGGTCTAR